MKKILYHKLMVLIMICFISKTTIAQTTDNWTEKSAKEWVDKGEWRNGFKTKLYAGIDNVEFAKQYHKNKAAWDKAFAFINNTKLDTVSPGKHLIDGDNVSANITDANTKEYDKTKWESHRKYIDLHLMIRGKERIGMMNPATAVVTDPYDEAKDIAYYDANTKGNYYIADPETLMIFFPQNSHRPVIHVDGYDKVKKLVIKIKVAQ